MAQSLVSIQLDRWLMLRFRESRATTNYFTFPLLISTAIVIQFGKMAGDMAMALATWIASEM
jgi:hypothetical protein